MVRRARNEPLRETFPSVPGCQILERLGTGGVGTVYLGRHEQLGRLVAVTLLRGEGVPVLSMEFVDGKNLKTLLRERGHLEVDEVVEIGLQISRALDHAYRHG